MKPISTVFPIVAAIMVFSSGTSPSLGNEDVTQEEFVETGASRFEDSEEESRPEADRRPEKFRERESERERGRRPDYRDSDRRPGERERRRGDRDRDERLDELDRNGDRGREKRGPRGIRGPAFFRLLDENHDGKLSKQELSEAAEKLQELDRDKDGSLVPRELLGGGPQRFRGRPQGFRRPFGPRHGFRPPFERRGNDYHPDSRRHFRRHGDGPHHDARRPKRHPDDAYREPRRPDDPVHHGRGDSNRGREGDFRRSRDHGPESSGFVERVLKRLDKNFDGKLSKAESSERLLKGFSRLDSNEDGSLDLDELKNAFFRRGGREAQREHPGRNREENEDE